MKKIIVTLLLPGLWMGLSACATQAEKQVDAQAAEQSAIQSPNQAAYSGRFAVRVSEKLSGDQKVKFLEIMDQTQAKVNDIRAQEGQLKAAMFQSLSEGNFNDSEMNVFKKKLKKLEGQKLDLMFSSLDDVRKLLKGNPEIAPDLKDFYRAHLDR